MGDAGDERPVRRALREEDRVLVPLEPRAVGADDGHARLVQVVDAAVHRERCAVADEGDDAAVLDQVLHRGGISGRVASVVHDDDLHLTPAEAATAVDRRCPELHTPGYPRLGDTGRTAVVADARHHDRAGLRRCSRAAGVARGARLARRGRGPGCVGTAGAGGRLLAPGRLTRLRRVEDGGGRPAGRPVERVHRCRRPRRRRRRRWPPGPPGRSATRRNRRRAAPPPAGPSTPEDGSTF